MIHAKRSIGLLTDSDRDESINKYKRRPPWESFKRMLRLVFLLLLLLSSIFNCSLYFSNLLDPHSRNRQRGYLRRRYALMLVISFFFLFFIFAIGSRIFNSPVDLEPLDAPFNHHRVASN